MRIIPSLSQELGFTTIAFGSASTLVRDVVGGLEAFWSCFPVEGCGEKVEVESLSCDFLVVELRCWLLYQDVSRDRSTQYIVNTW